MKRLPRCVFLERTIREGGYVVLEIGDAGRGLGLSAVVGTVRGCHGAIRVISRPAAGTTVRVFLPAVDNVPRRRDACPAEAAGKERFVKRGPRQTVLPVGKHKMYNVQYE